MVIIQLLWRAKRRVLNVTYEVQFYPAAQKSGIGSGYLNGILAIKMKTPKRQSCNPASRKDGTRENMFYEVII